MRESPGAMCPSRVSTGPLPRPLPCRQRSRGGAILDSPGPGSLLQRSREIETGVREDGPGARMPVFTVHGPGWRRSMFRSQVGGWWVCVPVVGWCWWRSWPGAWHAVEVGVPILLRPHPSPVWFSPVGSAGSEKWVSPSLPVGSEKWVSPPLGGCMSRWWGGDGGGRGLAGSGSGEVGVPILFVPLQCGCPHPPEKSGCPHPHSRASIQPAVARLC